MWNIQKIFCIPAFVRFDAHTAGISAYAHGAHTAFWGLLPQGHASPAYSGHAVPCFGIYSGHDLDYYLEKPGLEAPSACDVGLWTESLI